MATFADIEFELASTTDGGRRSPIWVGKVTDQGYMPHLRIVGDDEDYLGIEFVDGPGQMISPGENGFATVRFMYEPQVSYNALVDGAAFEIREGGQIVGTGRILRRY